MGKEVKFKKDGIEVSGYEAIVKGSGGIIVLHEWWGLNEQIKGFVDRLASEGLSAFAPDLYGGEIAPFSDPGKAGQLMTNMFSKIGEVENMLRASVSHLKEKVDIKKIGVTGFCCGGTLSMYLPAVASDIIDAAVPFYGLPQLTKINAENIDVPIFFILAEKDEFVNNDEVLEMVKKIWKNGVEVQVKIYPGVSHAFMNEKRPDVYHEESAKDAFELMLNFFRKHLK